MTLLFFVAENPEVGAELEAWGQGEALPPEAVQRVESMVIAYLRHLENAHYQMSEGTLDAELLDNWARSPAFAAPHFPEFWSVRKGSFSQAFVDYFELRHGLH